MSAGLSAVKNIEAGTSARGSSFYIAMRIMPQRQRQAMFEIYQFCRAVDDIADDAGLAGNRLQKLEKWRGDIYAVFNDNPPAHLKKLAVATQQFSLEKNDFMAVIDGMEMDVNGPIYAPNYATLQLYCDRVACAVGRLSVKIFGLEHETGVQLSHHLGNALQLTNILRDIDEDAAIGRLYLPAEFLAEANIKIENLNEVLSHPALPKVCNKLLAIAEKHFVEANHIMQNQDRYKIRTPLIMSQAYHVIYTKLEERGFDYPRTRIHLNKAKLGFILIRNLIF